MLAFWGIRLDKCRIISQLSDKRMAEGERDRPCARSDTNLEIGLRIDNSRYGPFWCGRSTLRTGMSLLRSYIHIIYHLEADFVAYLMV